MEPHLIVIALALAALVGVSLGLLGGGGSILTVPILAYVLGMEPREAIAADVTAFLAQQAATGMLVRHVTPVEPPRER